MALVAATAIVIMLSAIPGRTQANVSVAASTASESPVVSTADEPDLQQDVLPLLRTRCVSCHGPAKQDARLNLALPQGIRRGGEHGAAVTPGNLQDSLLWKRVEADEMPEDAPLPPEEKAILRRWIEAGAPGLPEIVSAEPDGDEHWAYQPLPAKPLAADRLPTVKNTAAVRTDVDRFLLSRLEAENLNFSAEASRSILVRRVSYDLTGLPPTVAERQEFLNDRSSDAYELMVERYLHSPRYGERWGKYWLDAVGYADSNGYFGADTDRPYAYRYRDYVVRSINADKPWDQFAREQLAGDELAGYQTGGSVSPQMVELLEAAHFLRNSPDGTDSSDGNPDEVRADKYAVLEGTAQIIGSSLLGMTVQCARCHDHKFEPFTQQDYYSLQAIIYPAFNVDEWVNPKERMISTATPAQEAENAEQVRQFEVRIAERRQQFTDWAKEHREPGVLVFADSFDKTDETLAELWSNTTPGDVAPAGSPPVGVDSSLAPGSRISAGTLRIIESGGQGDRALSTRIKVDWTPEEAGGWIQATFDLVGGGPTAPYVGYFVALRDFDDTLGLSGGNILFDGNAAGMATVHSDYPGSDSVSRGRIGKSGYVPGRNYGVRITNIGGDRYQVEQVADGVPEENSLMLSAADLPDGGFGFEYCCGRSFAVDNVLIEFSPPVMPEDEARKALAALHQQKRAELTRDLQQIEAERPQPIGRLALVADRSAKRPTVRLLTRGSYKDPGPEVEPAAPHVLSENDNRTDLTQHLKTGQPGTGRRMALATWLTRPNSRAAALLARVTVNRWWQHHFGTGIVSTPDNLGYSGSPPTHPELLDYLAGQLVQHQWSARAIHRLILNSSAYRQQSVVRPEEQLRDPQNVLLWRYPLRRLDAEAIRDGMLYSSGELDLQMYGPYVASERNGEGDVVVAESTRGALRRSVYLQQRRTQVPGILDVFDAPSIVFNCTARISTTVPLQSLKLLNSDFVRQRAVALASALRQQCAPQAESPDPMIELAFLRLFSRLPTIGELNASREFLQTQPLQYEARDDASEASLTDFCHMLLASNAFLYPE